MTKVLFTQVLQKSYMHTACRMYKFLLFLKLRLLYEKRKKEKKNTWPELEAHKTNSGICLGIYSFRCCYLIINQWFEIYVVGNITKITQAILFCFKIIHLFLQCSSKFE